MTFRTPAEAVELANNTRYGLAASVWSENINLALDIAPKLKAGTVWVNCTNMFDASSGFGGYRESGYGREGGKEGLYEYVRPGWEKITASTIATPTTPTTPTTPATLATANGSSPSGDANAQRAGELVADEDVRENGHAALGFHSDLPPIDRTPKLFIKGKQVRPDSGYSRDVYNPQGRVIGQVGEGNRKDIRNAVEAAHAASGWAAGTTHNRAQILYYIAGNLAIRQEEFARRIVEQTGRPYATAVGEVPTSIARLLSYAAWTGKYEGAVHRPP